MYLSIMDMQDSSTNGLPCDKVLNWNPLCIFNIFWWKKLLKQWAISLSELLLFGRTVWLLCKLSKFPLGSHVGFRAKINRVWIYGALTFFIDNKIIIFHIVVFIFFGYNKGQMCLLQISGRPCIAKVRAVPNNCWIPFCIVRWTILWSLHTRWSNQM